MLVAAVQLTSTTDRRSNLATATRLTETACDRGAQFVVLPEMVNLLGSPAELRAGSEPLDGPTATWARSLAERLGTWLVAGSFVRSVDGDRRRNTSLLVSPRGDIVAHYDKIHLFDCDVPGAVMHESDVTEPGDTVVVADAGPLRVVMSICYDLRFGELYRAGAAQGATVAVIPAAFTARTGPPHWEPLCRARAIENQCYVIAAAQVGASAPNLRWHGHSMVVDPWGTVVAQAPDGEGLALAEVDLERLDHIRATLPVLDARRPGAYG